MSSVNTTFGQRTFQPTVYSREPGLAFGSGDDFLSPRAINNIGSGFTRSITPMTSSGPFILGGDPFNHNATPVEVLLRTTDFARTINPEMSNDPLGLVRLPNSSYPYYQPVPDFGVNPNAMALLSASTQFQTDLVTEGYGAIPGYPVLGFGANPHALDYMGKTHAFVNAMIPHQPGAGTPVIYPTTGGQALYYPAPPLQPPFCYGPYQPTHYPRFGYTPGYGVIPYPVQPPYCPPAPPFCPPFPYPQPPVPQPPSNNPFATMDLLRNNPSQLPGFIPSNIQGGLTGYINRFNKMSEVDKVNERQKYNNPTTVNEAVLNSTGITDKGGLYKQGVVTNPFKVSNFLMDTNPYQTYNSGLVVTNGNGNGKIKGTPVKDFLLGTQARNNIIDGFGGQDDIIGSSKKDMVNAHPGDRVFTGADDDLVFYDFTRPNFNATRSTIIDMGEGSNDVMVLTVPGNASLESNSPVFRKLSDGTVSVTYNGIELQTRNVTKYIVIDTNGNIGGVYHTV